ncbi:flavin-dependent oxidoreductase [Bosea sp. (in: a-proteobacteria)]|jgi:2-polyprenyl-6-methoxyphenol hydroxylase-like FAD-dependent oxidoreductase|uniref:flavin-dependent oxidoreductase n=1 Tax=Bosea sp. (in: a-proteobacteria) TaxID=1871050 RepID=UPI002DDD4E02|nr:flavin-dependent oxidoreductase [Bosea sp. (in: a-proteobacteria)]HEV2512911.1 flavin-dependent oxidoreductase [Bosea sp. (in: a-proteobacteria)]
MKALIAGAGIGGLTTALFLHRAGIEVEIFERTDAVRELGVGINMLPHAVGLLTKLGLLDALDAAGIRTRELIYANRFGQIVWRELRGIDAGHAVPQFSIHRGRLLGLIHRAVIDRLGQNVIRTGCSVMGFEQDGSKVTAFLSEAGRTLQARGDLLIGADGIHSKVRAKLYPDEGSPIWNGVMLWRGATRWPQWQDGRTMAIAGGNHAKFVFYPIGNDPDDPAMRLTNWAVMARPRETAPRNLTLGDWSRPGELEQVLPFVRDRFHLDYVNPTEIIRATGVFHEYSNCDREPLPRWSFGRVTLLGDAAHPMYPVGSNGASQAILDAHCLAEYLRTHGSVEVALGAYDAERRPAMAQIVHANRKGGPEGVIDLVEARAPDGFDDVEAVASYVERERVVRGYASLAGFAADNPKGAGVGVR